MTNRRGVGHEKGWWMMRIDTKFDVEQKARRFERYWRSKVEDRYWYVAAQAECDRRNKR